MTGGLVAGLASPAAAAVNIAVQPGSFDMNPGDSKNVVVQLSGDKTDGVAVTFTAPSANGNITIKSVPADAGCDSPGGTTVTCSSVDVPQNGSKNLTFVLQAKSPSTLQPGQSLNDQAGSVTGGGASGSYKVNLKGPAQTAPAVQTVQEVSGTVNDSTTGKVLKGASVTMEDGAGKSRSATTDDAGRFRFLGTETNPIAPGNISISVTMNGYDAASKDVTVQAGKSATGQRLALVPIGSTASPVVPTMEESTPAGADSQSAAPGAANTANTSNDSGGGMSSYILIALGALLVVFGIVAIVLLLRRRGDDDDEEDLEEEPAPRRGGGGQRPGYRPAQADPTMVGAMGGAPTMINRGNANDATAIVRPGRVNDYDVPPDPYGAPLPRAGSGYGAAGGGYNDQAGFAQGAPSAGAGYGPSSRPAVDPYGPDYGAGGGGGGYNDQPGYGGGAQGGAYADSTQRWEPAAGNGYAGGQSGGGYGAGGANGYGAEPGANGYGAEPGANGYGGGGYNGNGANGYGADQGGYGPGGGGAGGYGPSAGQGGYGPGGGGDGYPSAGGGYSPSAGNGYNGQSDYDGPYAGRGGYEQRGGYEPAAGYERDGYERVPEPPRAGNGYDGANGNYEQRGGYGEPQGSRGQAGGNRRSLDWLDD
ncbi:carboxypeptidase regulatory-like domain-containing protein [Dactylosporangium aurantiacum]|uniref:Carboxypeptidase regulatory-like domain-containing protein n=1 Tax=Dactylosporangium aurantiacum TaxID=35754 RepID=A0A9Q9IKF4_9ACTN|nr:carboxypeptidase-like regulatory domain-containing protein [Dactylosporangium aurantiacum]MDG6107439.1 carboxypeptidase-like regulatory domain-containing protein [Dactylosporangium aurantiacum]UWZ54435.1 carboxypeptidase regulatory-like domain-containing protein [Dactylosporangium aurantiacum]